MQAENRAARRRHRDCNSAFSESASGVGKPGSCFHLHRTPSNYWTCDEKARKRLPAAHRPGPWGFPGAGVIGVERQTGEHQRRIVPTDLEPRGKDGVSAQGNETGRRSGRGDRRRLRFAGRCSAAYAEQFFQPCPARAA